MMTRQKTPAYIRPQAANRKTFFVIDSPGVRYGCFVALAQTSIAILTPVSREWLRRDR